jgi:uncharacterized membrane protein
MHEHQRDRRPLITAGTMLGLGLGGFFDGILFHQILQTHNMLSAKLPRTSIVNIEINMFWDGLFHAFCWLMTAAGVWLLWRAAAQVQLPRSSRTLTASLLLGWGLFNLIEGFIDHFALHVHHVVERLGFSTWDYAFVASGVVFIGAGYTLIRASLTASQDQ